MSAWFKLKSQVNQLPQNSNEVLNELGILRQQVNLLLGKILLLSKLKISLADGSLSA